MTVRDWMVHEVQTHEARYLRGETIDTMGLALAAVEAFGLAIDASGPPPEIRTFADQVAEQLLSGYEPDLDDPEDE